MNASQDIRFRFSPSSAHSRKVLGPLEGEIMEIVWESGPTTVSAVHKTLRGHKDIAYTTVMTTMSRLAKKHLLNQDTSSTSYVYSPVLNRRDFEEYVVNGVIMGLFDDFGDTVIDSFVECARSRGPASWARLRDLACSD